MATSNKIAVLRFYQERPGVVMHIGEAAERLDLTNLQVSSAIQSLVREGLLRRDANAMYSYTRNNSRPEQDELKKGELLEVVGVGKKPGHWLAVDGEGKRFFKVQEIEV